MSEIDVPENSKDRDTSPATGGDHSDAPLGQRMEDWLFGYDYFLAHRSTDGKKYALALYEELTKQGNELSCFLDVKNYNAGGKLIAMQSRALKKTTRLLVIVTPDAHSERSTYMLKEVEEFQRLHPQGVVVPIGRRASLMERWFPRSKLLPLLPRFPDAICILESAQAFKNHKPSGATIAKLLNDFTEERRLTKRLSWIKAVALLLLLLAVAATGLGWSANEAAIQEKAARNIAEEQTKVAEENERNARATLCRSDYLRSLEFSSKKEPAMAIAYLVRGLRSFPEDQVAAQRLAVLLRERKGPLPLPATKHIESHVAAYSFAKDDTRLLCLTNDGMIIDFNIKTQSVTNRSWQGPIGANKIWITPNSETLIVARTTESSGSPTGTLTSFVEAWDLGKKTSLWRRQYEGRMTVDLQSDGGRILVASSPWIIDDSEDTGEPEAFDINEGNTLGTEKVKIEEFDPSGKAMRSAFYSEGFEVDQDSHFQVRYGGRPSNLCLLYGNTIRGYNLENGKCHFNRTETTSGRVAGFAVSHNKQRLAVFGGSDLGRMSDFMPQGYFGFVHLMSSLSGEILHRYGSNLSADMPAKTGEAGGTPLEEEEGFFPTRVEFSADDSALAIASDAGSSFWVGTAENYKALTFSHRPVLADAYNDLDASHVLTTGSVVESKSDKMYISHCNGGTIAGGGSNRLIPHLSFFNDQGDFVRDSLITPDGIQSFAYSDRRRLLVAETGGEIRFWKLLEADSEESESTIRDDQMVASAPDDHRRISIKDGWLLFSPIADNGGIESRISLEWIDKSVLDESTHLFVGGHLISAESSGLIHIWDLSRRKEVTQVKGTPYGRMAASPNGEYFCYESPPPGPEPSRYESALNIVKAATGEAVATLGGVRSWAFANDLMVASRNKSIDVFENSTGSLRVTFPIEGNFECVLSENQFLCSGHSLEFPSVHVCDLSVGRIVKSWELEHYRVDGLKATPVQNGQVAICAQVAKYGVSKLQLFDYRSGMPTSPIIDGFFEYPFWDVGENFFQWGPGLYETRDWTVVDPDFHGQYLVGNQRRVPSWALKRALQIVGFRWEGVTLKRSDLIKPDLKVPSSASEAWKAVFDTAPREQ